MLLKLYRRLRGFIKQLYLSVKYLLIAFRIGNKYSEKLSSLRSFCLFIGYARSGHSLVASLLDAHKNIVLSQELNIIRYLKFGFTFKMICNVIIYQNKKFAKSGYTHKGHDYSIPGSDQGCFEDIQIIGDKYAQAICFIAHNDKMIALLDKLPKVKIIHVVRNPFDVIASKYKWHPERGKEHAIKIFFRNAEYVQNLKKINRFDIFDCNYDDLMKSPVTTLKDLYEWLDVPISLEKISNHSRILKIQKSDIHTCFNKSEISLIQTTMQKYSFFHRYILHEV